MDYNQHHRRINKLFLNYLFKQNLFFFILLLFINHRSEAQNLTLVTSALRTFQTHACDGQLLHLNCKPNTVVSILFAQYGISNGQICPNNNLTSSSTINENISSSKNCTESLRYSLLQKVESTCREKSNCIIDSSTRSLGVTDRCPSTAKYAEVAYKCRPYTFQNKIACSEKTVDISCPFNQRILIYSAFFGTSSRTPPECAKNTIPSHLLKVHQPNTIKKPFKEYCVAKQVTKLVADRCHTQTNCSINAQFNQFQLPECINDLTNDDKQTEVHLKVTYACVQIEVLRTNLIGSISNNIGNSISNNLGNSIINTFNINNKINYSPQNKTIPKDSSLSNLLNESSTKNSILNKPEFNNDLYENNLLPSTEYNQNKNTLLDQEIQPTDNDNLLNIRPNEPQSPWPHQINELNLDFKTPKSNEPFKDWSSFCQYIENNLERLLVYLLVILCVALLFCFIFLGFSHLTDKTKKTEQQCSSLECSVQEDCCDSKPDLSNSVSLNKGNHVSSVFAGFQSFEDDNPTMDEMIGELNRNGSFIGMQQQLHNQLSNQLAQQNCKSISNQILLSANTAAVVANESVGSLLNCHQLNNQMVNNRFTSTFSPSHNNYNSIDKFNNSYFQNTIYSNQQNSPQKLINNALPQSASFYNMQTYTPTIYTSTANPTILGTYQPNLQQQSDQTTFQQLQPAQLLISNQSDNENGSIATTMTTIGSQTDSSSSSTEMANSANGILHSNLNNLNNQIHSSIHNNQLNSISPSNYNPVTLQILTTPNHLNDVQLNEATVFQQNL